MLRRLERPRVARGAISFESTSRPLCAPLLPFFQAYVSALRKSTLKRTVTRVEVADKETQSAVNAALQSLSATKEGQEVPST